ncbi:MAG: endonuclease, partial [Oscillospiraceae bacterium]|nr:endonuclease [Oscillospiraceae bacterium]
MFKFGVRAHDYGKKTADVLFAEMAADGFTGMQLALNKAIEEITSICDVTEKDVNLLQDALSRNSMEIAVFGSYVELAMAEE